jgi:hypothetical protein
VLKNTAFIVFRKIPKSKAVSFEKDIKTNIYLISIFGINLYIWRNNKFCLLYVAIQKTDGFVIFYHTNKRVISKHKTKWKIQKPNTTNHKINYERTYAKSF